MTLAPHTARSLEGGAVRHGFFTRRGGVSKGVYATLNCGPGSRDNPEAVAENRARVAHHLASRRAPLNTLYQVHSADVIEAGGPWQPGASPKADAMVTSQKGLILGVLAADCAPVLLADAKVGVVAAVHAGWRGAFAGVIEATVKKMLALGANSQDIRAAVGPCIAQNSYEVGQEFYAGFTAKSPENAAFFKPGKKGRHHFDLSGFVSARLTACGVRNPEAIAADTYSREKEFFSFRRATHRGESDYGRQISAIMLAP